MNDERSIETIELVEYVESMLLELRRMTLDRGELGFLTYLLELAMIEACDVSSKLRVEEAAASSPEEVLDGSDHGDGGFGR